MTIDSDIEVQYRLVGTGWSECVLDIHGHTCTVNASNLSDALGGFVEAVNHILRGGSRAQFSFDDKPGEYRWVLTNRSDNVLSITILAFAELWGNRDDSEGKAIYQATCPAHNFAKALLVGLNDLLDEYGFDGYKKRWVDAEYPVDQYMELCRLLDMRPSNKARQHGRS